MVNNVHSSVSMLPWRYKRVTRMLGCAGVGYGHAVGVPNRRFHDVGGDNRPRPLGTPSNGASVDGDPTASSERAPAPRPTPSAEPRGYARGCSSTLAGCPSRVQHLPSRGKEASWLRLVSRGAAVQPAPRSLHAHRRLRRVVPRESSSSCRRGLARWPGCCPCRARAAGAATTTDPTVANQPHTAGCSPHAGEAPPPGGCFRAWARGARSRCSSR
jgi:hypothetical protein